MFSTFYSNFLPTPLLPGCFLLLFCFLTFPPFTIRHMREIQALHSRQKEEIDCLFTKLGKVAGVCDTAVCVLSKPAANCSSLGRRPGPPCRCAPARHHTDRQEETTDQKQILQIVQNQFCTQQQESATARWAFVHIPLPPVVLTCYSPDCGCVFLFHFN